MKSKGTPYEQTMELLDQLDHVMITTDVFFQKLQRGGVFNTASASASFVGTLKKANGLFKRGIKLSENQDFTDEEKLKIEARVNEVKAKYETYVGLLNASSEVAKNFMKKKPKDDTNAKPDQPQ